MSPAIEFADWEEFILGLAGAVDDDDSFIIHGSIAMGFYGPRRPSEDVDVITKRSWLSIISPEHDKTKVSKILEEQGFTAFASKMLDDAKGFVRRYRKGRWRIDVHETDAATFDKLKRRSTVIESADGKHHLYVISKKDLIRMKRHRSSPLDLADIKALEHFEERERET